VSYAQLERPILGEFGIHTEEQCKAVMERLLSSFEKRSAAF
jgi:hypothetical protein